MGHGRPTREEQERHDREKALQQAHWDSQREQARNYNGLKSVAASAHAALTEALPYVNNDAIKEKMKDVLTRLNLWGAHP